MNNFETPNDALAYYAGVSVSTYESREDAIVADRELLDALGRPDLDREARPEVSESDVLNPDETVIAGYGGDHRAVLSFGRND